MTVARLPALACALAPALAGTAYAKIGPKAGQESLQAWVPALRTCEELVEEIRIGSLDGPAEYSFSDINSIAVSTSGTVYVEDTHPPSVREFDAAGRFAQRIGREGEGPGEYLSIAGVSVLPDGRLALWDRGARRITVYRADGGFERVLPIGGVSPPYPYVDRSFQSDTAGRYYLRIFVEASSLSPGSGSIRQGYVRIAPDGAVLDTLAAPEAPAATNDRSIVIHTRSGDRGPFPERMLDALSPFGHLVAGFNATYAFSMLDPAGTVQVEPEGYRPVEVTAGEHREWGDRVAYAARRSGASLAEVPRRKPAYRDLWVDAEGRTWVQRYAVAVKRDEPIPELWLDDPEGGVPRLTWAEPVFYDVFGTDGEPLRCVGVPDDSEVMASRGTLVWGISRGDLDEEYVVRWRIR